MDQQERLDWLIDYLCKERSDRICVPTSFQQKRALLRALANVRPPVPISEAFLQVQDAFLQEEARQRGIVQLKDISALYPGSKLSLWKGDITQLQVDAIVNAANSELLGCFAPGHACIDNAIHTFAGVQLRLECGKIMGAQGYPEPTGCAKITPAYNLPSRFILHTVGPIVEGALTQNHRQLLHNCYRSCLDLAEAHGIRHVAFCCISTGIFRFPNQQAAEVAVDTVTAFLKQSHQVLDVIFNVFTEQDHGIYAKLLTKTV